MRELTIFQKSFVARAKKSKIPTPKKLIAAPIAVVGTVIKIFFTGKFDFLSTMIYLAAGWIVLLDIKNLVTNFHPTGLFWLAAGGLLYTGGVFFYLKESIPRNHEIWHGFVLGGAGCHYFTVLFYVI